MIRSTSKRSIKATTCLALFAAAVGSGTADARAVEQIERYCTTSWRNAQIAQQDWPDCTQEAFAELLSRISADRIIRAIERNASDERRELNRSIWCTIQRWRRARRFQPMEGDSHPDVDSGAPEAAAMETEIRQTLALAMSRLSDRQHTILSRWSNGDSVAEIAADLHISAARVSDEKYKALQKMRQYLEIEPERWQADVT